MAAGYNINGGRKSAMRGRIVSRVEMVVVTAGCTTPGEVEQKSDRGVVLRERVSAW